MTGPDIDLVGNQFIYRDYKSSDVIFHCPHDPYLFVENTSNHPIVELTPKKILRHCIMIVKRELLVLQPFPSTDVVLSSCVTTRTIVKTSAADSLSANFSILS